MGSMVKVWNTTNSGSAVLKQFSLDDKALEVCGNLVLPGESVELPEEDWVLVARGYERLVKLGALSLKAPEVPEASVEAPKKRKLRDDITEK